MTSSRISKSLIAAMLFVLVVVPLSTVFAVPPIRTEEEFHFPDELIHTCDGFDILAASDYKITRMEFFDRNGDLKVVREHWAVTNGVLYNSLHPEIALPEGPDHVTWTIDPVTGHQRIAGMALHLTVPGHGVVAIDAGTALLTSEWGVLWERGPHMFFEGQMDPVCAYFEYDGD